MNIIRSQYLVLHITPFRRTFSIKRDINSFKVHRHTFVRNSKKRQHWMFKLVLPDLVASCMVVREKRTKGRKWIRQQVRFKLANEVSVEFGTIDVIRRFLDFIFRRYRGLLSASLLAEKEDRKLGRWLWGSFGRLQYEYFVCNIRREDFGTVFQGIGPSLSPIDGILQV